MIPTTMAMLDLYTWHTPEGRVPGIALAELDLAYNLHLVDVARADPAPPGLLEGYPSPTIPTLVDRDVNLGRTVVFEAGAILQYLGEKCHRLVPEMLGAHRADILSWVAWEASGPRHPFAELTRLGQLDPRERDSLAHARMLDTSMRFVMALDRQLVDRDYITADYSAADIACYPTFAALAENCPDVLDGAPEVRRWLHRIGIRPAVREGMRFEPLARAA